MKLYYSKTSPFARKVQIVAHRLGLESRLELVQTDVFGDTSQYRAVNPLIKIPALEMDNGEFLVNSPFICQYLASLRPGTEVFPLAPELWTALHLQAVADGGADAAVLRRMETQRSPDKRDPQFDRRQKEKIQNALEHLEQNLFQLSRQDLRIAEISAICFLDYLQLRFSHEKWNERFPRLHQWVQGWAERSQVVRVTKP